VNGGHGAVAGLRWSHGLKHSWLFAVAVAAVIPSFSFESDARADTVWSRYQRGGVLTLFVGPLAPVARFVLPLLVLAVVIYVVYRIVTWSSD